MTCHPPPYCGECSSCRAGIRKTLDQLAGRETEHATILGQFEIELRRTTFIESPPKPEPWWRRTPKRKRTYRTWGWTLRTLAEPLTIGSEKIPQLGDWIGSGAADTEEAAIAEAEALADQYVRDRRADIPTRRTLRLTITDTEENHS